MKILIAEDEPVSRLSLASLARRLGHCVFVAADGNEAWALFQSEHPDVILTDWLMPGMDGLELCRRIRGADFGTTPDEATIPIAGRASLSPHPKECVPADTAHGASSESRAPYPYVALVTALCDGAHQVKGMRGGADDYLTKPVRPDELEACLFAAERVTGLHRDLAQANARLAQAFEKQTRIAETLQRSLLMMPPSDAFPGINVEVLYEAASDEAKVGGDFADVFGYGEGKLALVVGDVIGKGLKAAAHTAELKFALRAYLCQPLSGEEALRAVNRLLLDSRKRWGPRSNGSPTTTAGPPLVSLVLVMVDVNTGWTTCYAAGAEAPLLARVRNGGDASDPASVTLTEVAAGGSLLGFEDDPEFDVATFQLHPNETLIVTTDGITEARIPGQRPFGRDGLGETARQSIAAGWSLSDLCGEIYRNANAYAAGARLDDMCILAARLTNS